MKSHKSFLIAATLIAAVSLSGCKQDPADSSNKVELSIKNGSLNIDPATTKYIDLTFPTEMNRNYGGYIYYDGSDYDVLDARWANGYTYRFTVELLYGTSYKFVINDTNFLDSQNNTNHSYNRNESFWRDTKGNVIDTISIEFSTISSPRTGNKTYTINIPYKYKANLVDNNNYNPNTQQLLININSLLDHDKVRAGDTVKIPYKIKSEKELNNIFVNLVDDTGWFDLTQSENDIVLIDHLDANTEKSGTMEFQIKKNMSRKCSLQIWTTYTANPNLVSFDFLVD